MGSNIYYPGDIVYVLDNIDCQTRTMATVKGIEEDEEISGIFYLYLVAVEESLNDKYEDKIGCWYWEIMASNSPYITILSRAN